MEPAKQSVWPQPPVMDRPRSMWVDVGCIGLILCGLAAILAPVYMQSNESTISSSCLFNMKQSGLAVLMYSEDYDNRLPHRDWMDATYSYSKNWGIYACPIASRENDTYFGFAFELTMIGKKTGKVGSPATQPLIYDSDLLYKNATAPIRVGLMKPGRHHEGNNVGYLDGHCKRMSDADAAKRWP